MASITKNEHKSYGMGLHDEVLTGRTQQTFFNSEEGENFFYHDAFEVDFNNALKIGVNNIDLAIKEEGRSCVSDDPVDYLNNKISYNFDARKKDSLKLFLSMIS